jgi:uncharacterized protein with HEPN domain/predicted nucleotidyltransferase
MDLREKRQDIIRIAAEHGARNLRVFGSIARGDDRAHSDVDLLVDMDPDRSLRDVVGLGQDLEELLDRRVDVPAQVCTRRSATASWPSHERVYLGHIRDAINDIEEYTSVGRDAFMSERMRQDAVIRKLEIIGEAVKQLSDATKDRRSEIQWKRSPACAIVSRTITLVDLARVWRVVEPDLPVLKAAVIALL